MWAAMGTGNKIQDNASPTDRKRMSMIAEQLAPLAVPIDSMKLDPRNSRLHPGPNIEAIKRSLEAYGQRKPIVVNAKNQTIEAGNGLWQAAKDLGWTEIAAVMVEDAPDMATGYSIMDNRSADMAEWDMPILKDLLLDLDSLNYPLDLTGFSEKEVEDLMTQFHPVDLDSPDPDKGNEQLCHCPKCGFEFRI